MVAPTCRVFATVSFEDRTSTLVVIDRSKYSHTETHDFQELALASGIWIKARNHSCCEALGYEQEKVPLFWVAEGNYLP